MAKDLRVGDRVRVYGREWVGLGNQFYFNGRVTDFAQGHVLVKTGTGMAEATVYCHPKQIRRLKPKAKPREWILFASTETNLVNYSWFGSERVNRNLMPGEYAVRVREVKRCPVRQKLDGGSRL